MPRPSSRQAGRRSADDLQRFFRLLLDADETLGTPARTIDPQLVLEMAVLRLATLPSLVPLDDLVARLQGVARSGAPSGGTPAGERAAPPAASKAADGDLWELLLGRLQQEKISLYMALASGRLLGVDDGVLRVGVENEAMRRDLGRKETLERLQVRGDGRGGTAAPRRSRADAERPGGGDAARAVSEAQRGHAE